jgi:hypothetical protein
MMARVKGMMAIMTPDNLAARMKEGMIDWNAKMNSLQLFLPRPMISTQYLLQ